MLFVMDILMQEVAGEPSTIMGFISGALKLFGPPIVAVLAVPAFDLVKLLLKLKGKLPAWLQQAVLVPLMAFALSWLAALTNTVLPTSLEMFTADTTAALISAGMAFAIKAGQKPTT